jgi:hypothetical protein
MPATRVCARCDEPFELPPGRGAGRVRYCSPKCRDGSDLEKARGRRKALAERMGRLGRPREPKPELVPYLRADRQVLTTPSPDRAAAARAASKESGKRWGVDPCTCDREYDDEEREFLMAMDRYRRENRRPWPTWSEVLEVLKSLGYRKVAEAGPLPGRQ